MDVVKLRAKVGLSVKGRLDFDACYLGLSKSEIDRQTNYRKFVGGHVSEAIDKQILEAIERCQLTGTGKFVDEIEKRMGRRIDNRGPGRPKNGDKA